MRKRVIAMFILITFIYLISFADAQTIDVDYPDYVEFGEAFDFTVYLNDFEEDVYDVKIEIKTGTNNIAQRYFEDKWRSTYYWMYGAINLSEESDKTFSINITEDFEGTADVEVKIKSGGFSQDLEDYTIEVGIPEEEEETPEENQEEEAAIELKFEWDEEDIINGEEFYIDLESYNLKDKEYDVKVWIEDTDEEEIISARYNDDEEKWESGRYYLNDFFNGPGNKTGEIRIRINEDYSDFIGNARIYYKIRDEEEIDRKIEVLEPEEIIEEEPEDEVEEKVDLEKQKQEIIERLRGDINKTKEDTITGNVIKLGNSRPNNEDSKTEQTQKYYEAKNELIKKYSIFGFAALCVGISVLIIIKKL